METIVSTCRRFAGLLAIWILILGGLAAWPGSPHNQRAYDSAIALYGPDVRLSADAIFSHTGLWTSVIDADGDVVYVRELRRQ